jgi:hypothetical protein
MVRLSVITDSLAAAAAAGSASAFAPCAGGPALLQGQPASAGTLRALGGVRGALSLRAPWQQCDDAGVLVTRRRELITYGCDTITIYPGGVFGTD